MNKQSLTSSANILWFSDEDATDGPLVGGKGANLGIMTRAGFDVPPGFSVTTAGYAAFLEQTGLIAKISQLLNSANYDDAGSLEVMAENIREAITIASMPDGLAREICDAYELVGCDTYVAVRSSGTAEDLAGASFAGLHDTYLDIKGDTHLLDAVKRCWASLWTSRAISYRNTRGFEHFECPIAVVVQAMISSEVSGVMFTGNPMSGATNEIIINASWGLGEAIVQGITTPDEFALQQGDLRIIEKTLGSKKIKIIRDAATGYGNITVEVSQAEQALFCLPDEAVKNLAALGREIQAHYGDFPQDIEWALADGQLYVLQSRPITAVDFSWDAEISLQVPGVPLTGDEVWGRGWADEGWNGAVTPLMFTWYLPNWDMGQDYAGYVLGYPEISTVSSRQFVYYKGEVYYNLALDRAVTEKTCPPPCRVEGGALYRLPRSWHDEIQSTPFDYWAYARMYARFLLLHPKEGLETYKHVMRDWITNPERMAEADGLSPEELRHLGDRELKQYIKTQGYREGKFFCSFWVSLLYMYRDLRGFLARIIDSWYDGENEGLLTDVLTGTSEHTFTQIENKEMWLLAQKIRNAPVLVKAFKENEGAGFFATIESLPEASDFLKEYWIFAKKNAHRGHSDRDIYYNRRCEDLAIDYRNLSLMMSTGDVDPDQRDEETNLRRNAAIAEALGNIGRKPMGMLKVVLFNKIVDFLHDNVAIRDNERHFKDRTTWAAKKGLVEAGRRARERQPDLFVEERDFYFLTVEELYDVLDGCPNIPLFKVKIAARKNNFDAFDKKEVSMPMYIHRWKPIEIDAAQVHDVPGVFQGTGTSRGKTVGRARVVNTLEEIGRVQLGEILVTNSTDPGWTPVFMIIKGIVLETGGMLAHGSLLAREYGFPAICLEESRSLIPDGAMISLDGDTGVVTLLPEEDEQMVVADSEPK